MSEMAEKMMLDGTEHDVGDADCGACWTSSNRCECGGIIHNAFGDENYDCDYWLYYKCDECGATDAP